MINRILIRIKVVQMLYSYLLTRTDFKIAGRPAEADTSNDRRFAYKVYLDLLMLLLEISGNDTHSGKKQAGITVDKKMARSRVAAALAADSDIRRIIFRNETDIDVLRPLAQHLHDAVVASSAFRDYSRKRTAGLAEEVACWQAVIPTVIAKDSSLDAAFRSLEGYSHVGFSQGVQMVLDTLASYYGATAGYARACDQLEASLNKAYELYVSVFALIIELTRAQEERIENAKYKHLATPEEHNPNTRFIDNAFVARLMESKELEALINDNKVSWSADIALINSLLAAITSSEIYTRYMESPSTDYAADCDFWRNILGKVIFNNDDLAEALEDKSVFWNDDLQIMGTFVLKTIKTAEADADKPIVFLPRYKDDEDARFGAELFRDTVTNRDRYSEYINRFINTGSWDSDRQPFMDRVIMMTAISEFINYPKIPVPVTMNEYIEIANSYSTAKSGQFVNGILFNVVNMLRQEGILLK